MAFALLPAAIQFVALLATSTRYGFHRDELYFVVAGSHPALGYPDQPPLVPLLSHALYSLDPGSPFLLRLPSAFVAAATTVLAALIAREVGGGRRAQLIASACTASAGFALAVGHFVTTTTIDLLATTLFLWLRSARSSGAPGGRCRRREWSSGSASRRSRRSESWPRSPVLRCSRRDRAGRFAARGRSA